MCLKLVALFSVVAVLSLVEASLFERCGLVQALREQSFPADKLAEWVCLIEHATGGYTDIVNTESDKSKSYSVFRINDKHWCSNTSTPGNECNVTCAELRVDNITKAAQCAMKIYNRHGFQFWPAWKNHCQKPADLPDISNCTPEEYEE